MLSRDFSQSLGNEWRFSFFSNLLVLVRRARCVVISDACVQERPNFQLNARPYQEKNSNVTWQY